MAATVASVLHRLEAEEQRRKEGDESNAKAIAELKAALEALKPEPSPTPEPEPTPTPDPRPWITPIQTDSTFGTFGQQTTVKSSQVIEHATVTGEILIPKGVTLELKDCTDKGSDGLSSTIAINNRGGHLITDRFELAGSNGGIFQGSGIWTPRNTWLHDEGADGTVLFQAAYVGGGRIEDFKELLIQSGPGYGFQCYSPPSYPEPVLGVTGEGIECSGFTVKGGIVLAERVSGVNIRGVNAHGNHIGIRAYGEVSGVISDSHVWGNDLNLNNESPGLSLKNVLEAKP